MSPSVFTAVLRLDLKKAAYCVSLGIHRALILGTLTELSSGAEHQNHRRCIEAINQDEAEIRPWNSKTRYRLAMLCLLDASTYVDHVPLIDEAEFFDGVMVLGVILRAWSDHGNNGCHQHILMNGSAFYAVQSCLPDVEAVVWLEEDELVMRKKEVDVME